MKQNHLGGLVVILFVCILALGCGALFGMMHVGEDFSKEILPTSLTRSSDVVQVVDEKSFEAQNITVKYQTQTKVKQVTKNYTNTTNRSSDTNSNSSSKNRKTNHSSNTNRTNY